MFTFLDIATMPQSIDDIVQPTLQQYLVLILYLLL